MTDESRDHAIEQLLRRLRADGPEDTGACVDAEALAAWTDGGLDPATRATVEMHVSTCGRCQAILAAMMRASTPAAVEASASAVLPSPAPAVASATRAGAAPIRLAGWRRPPRMVRWFVPLAAGLAAATVWMVRPGLSTEGGADRAESTQARVESNVPAAAPPPIPSAEPVAPPAATAPPATPAGAFSPEPQTARAVGGALPTDALSRDARAERKAETMARADELAEPVGKVIPSAEGSEKRRAAALEPEPLAAPPARQAAAPAPAPAQAMADAAPAPSIAKSAEATALNDARGAAPAPPASRATPSEAAANAVGQASGRMQVAGGGLVIVSPDPRVQWRVGAGGVLDRSQDAGGTWQLIAGGVGAMTAGASPSVAVCWLVGPRGAVWLTADGRTWRRAASPTADDLVGVRATDGRAASVTTAGGRVFRTVDGGATWQPVPR